MLQSAQKATSAILVAIAMVSWSTPISRADDSLQGQLEDVGVSERWLYEDWLAAKEAAERDKKPIFALFR